MKKTTTLQLLTSIASLVVALTTTTAPMAVRASATDLYVTASDGIIFELAPSGAISFFDAGIAEPRGIRFNDAGEAFVAISPGGPLQLQGTVLKYSAPFAPTTFGIVPGDTFLQGVAINSTGNVFVVAQDNTSPTRASSIYKFAPGGGTPTLFGSTPGQSFGLTFDSAGNLLVADALDRTILSVCAGWNQNGVRFRPWCGYACEAGRFGFRCGRQSFCQYGRYFRR
jgi:DNA-binding beta-propeller fold protein YncE